MGVGCHRARAGVDEGELKGRAEPAAAAASAESRTSADFRDRAFPQAMRIISHRNAASVSRAPAGRTRKPGRSFLRRRHRLTTQTPQSSRLSRIEAEVQICTLCSSAPSLGPLALRAVDLAPSSSSPQLRPRSRRTLPLIGARLDRRALHLSPPARAVVMIRADRAFVSSVSPASPGRCVLELRPSTLEGKPEEKDLEMLGRGRAGRASRAETKLRQLETRIESCSYRRRTCGAERFEAQREQLERARVRATAVKESARRPRRFRSARCMRQVHGTAEQERQSAMPRGASLAAQSPPSATACTASSNRACKGASWRARRAHVVLCGQRQARRADPGRCGRAARGGRGGGGR